MLQVCIHDDHAITGNIVKACRHGILLTEVAREVNIADARVILSQFLEDIQRLIHATIIDKEPLPIVALAQFRR